MADSGKSGGGSTAIVAIIAIVALLAVGYFVYSQGLLSGGTQKIDADITVTPPKAP